jgi:hypothetical protein
MTGPVSPSQLVVAIQKDISNLYVQSPKHVCVHGFFQLPEMEYDTMIFIVIVPRNYLQLMEKNG